MKDKYHVFLESDGVESAEVYLIRGSTCHFAWHSAIEILTVLKGGTELYVEGQKHFLVLRNAEPFARCLLVHRFKVRTEGTANAQRLLGIGELCNALLIIDVNAIYTFGQPAHGHAGNGIGLMYGAGDVHLGSRLKDWPGHISARANDNIRLEV